jgi:hypothetical protein
MKTSLALSLGISLLGPSLAGSSWGALATPATFAVSETAPMTAAPPPSSFSGSGVAMVGQPVATSTDPNGADQLAADSEAGGLGGLGLTADDYAAAIEYDVSYDDSVAQTYDDGYDPQAYTQFQDTLAPYGSWVDDPAYGEVWVPSASVVGDDFSPYATNGGWVESEYGWTWVSGWSWGWAPFHYGRWTTIANHGWGWVPGTIWGPSWVSWRVGAGCVGWAPLPPRGIHLGSPLGRGSPWRFVAAASFGHTRGAYLPPAAVPRIFGRMSVVSNARRLGAGGSSSVRVNVGPTRRGAPGPAPAHLASVAPGALPRFAVQPRAGAPVAGRPWVHAGVTRQLAFNRVVTGPTVAGARGSVPNVGDRAAYHPPYHPVYGPAYGATMGARPGPGSHTVTGRVPPPGARSYRGGLAAGLQSAPMRRGVPAQPSFGPSPSGRYGSSRSLGWARPATVAVPTHASPPIPGGHDGRPAFSSPPPAVRAFVPPYRGTTYGPPQRWQGAPQAPVSAPASTRFSAGSFGGAGRSFGGSAPSFGSGHPSFGGSAPSFGGGGHPSFGGGGHPSFGGGGGGGRRR